MKVSKVVLNNFAQHKNVEHSFCENIIGIVGRNGSGKSNFANSISIAVTGEFGKKKKKDLITFGESTGGIHLEGELNGKSFIIDRALHNNNCVMSYGDKEFDGADTVNEKVLEIIGCEKSFLSNMVFVSQTDILGVLFGSPAERNKTLRKFFGLQKLESLDEALSSWHRNISYPVLIDEEQAKTAIANLSKIIEENNESIEAKEVELESLIQSMDGIDEAKIAKNYEDSLNKLKLEASIVDITQAMQKGRDELKNLVKPQVSKDELSSIKESCNNLSLLIGAKNNELDLINLFIRQDNENIAKCPLCNSHVDSSNRSSFIERRDELKKEIKTLSFRMSELSKKLTSLERELSSYEHRSRYLEGSIDDYIRSLKRKNEEIIERKFPAHPPEKYKQGLDQIEKTKNKINFIKSEIETIKSSNNKLNEQVNIHISDVDKAKNTKCLFSGTKIHHSRVSRIRDIFRHDGLSGLYINQQMNKMSESINEYLQRFGAAYLVKLGVDNEFVCDFGNKKRPSSDLSCGQKVVLSLAFRFAAREIFTTGVNMIVLDEPTTWLDRDTISNFKNIIESIHDLSETNDLQTLIVTHERSLMPYFKQIIEF